MASLRSYRLDNSLLRLIRVSLVVTCLGGGAPAAAQPPTFTPPPGALLYDPIPLTGGDPYAIQPSGLFSPLQQQPSFRNFANPVPFRGRMFLRGEYLGWWPDALETPPLVTSSPNGTPQNQSAFIGGPATDVLFGGDLNDAFRSGVRVSGGWYVDPSRYWGIGGDYYQLFGEDDSFSVSSNGGQILGRPFFNIVSGRETAQLLSFPALVSGGVDVNAETQLQSFGIHVRADAINAPNVASQIANACAREPRLDLLVGFRYLSLDDSLRFSENLTSLTNVAAGTVSIDESFETENQFQGLELGVIREIPFGRFWFESTGKVSLGTNRQTVRIAGSTLLTENGVPERFNGGLLAQRSNIGVYERNEFAVLPELGATLGWHVTPRFSVNVGYTFIYLSNAVRAGDQIDTDVNPGLLPVEDNPLSGPLRPRFLFRQTDFYVQGITVGGDFRF